MMARDDANIQQDHEEQTQAVVNVSTSVAQSDDLPLSGLCNFLVIIIPTVVC